MSLQDSLFVEEVENDVTIFAENKRNKRVLIFPPVNNYRRFLIHQFVQEQFADLLHTFSIGQGAARRTVVCYKSDLIRHPQLNGAPSSDKSGVNKCSISNMGFERSCSPTASPENSRQRQVKTTPAAQIYRPPAARKAQNITTMPESSAPRQKQKRPDRAVYVPKHRRSTDNEGSLFLQDESPPRRSKNDQLSKVSSVEPTVQQSQHSITQETSLESSSIIAFSSTSCSDSIITSKTVPSDLIEVNSSNNIESNTNNGLKSLEYVSMNNSSVSNRDNNLIDPSDDSPKNFPPNSVHDNPQDINEKVQMIDKSLEIKSSTVNLVSDVLIITESSELKPIERLDENVDSSAMSLRPPEKKPKKVARAKSKPAAPPSLPVKVNRDECDWDSLFDENGECLDPTLIDELTAAVGEVTIEQPKNEYKTFTRPVEVSHDEFGHVVEIYNFPSDFKTSDLAAVFTPWKNGGFELKWVDDTHCLGVFSSPVVAAEVLASDHSLVKTRPMCEATALSRTKARKSAEFLQPYKSRPETCAALARRLVTGALGVRLATARQEREHEKVLLREAKERRRLANKQREDVWEGIIAEK